MIINHVITNMTNQPFDNKHVKKLMNTYMFAAVHNWGWRMKDSEQQKFIVDPFARESITSQKGEWGYLTISNDLNPIMPTDFHLECNEFAATCLRGKRIGFCLFDPPYTLRMLKEHYMDEGTAIADTIPMWQTNNMWGTAKDIIARRMIPGSYVISFGYHTHGFGKHRGFEKQEILILEQAGSPDRYDILVTVEKKVQSSLFDLEPQNGQDDEE